MSPSRTPKTPASIQVLLSHSWGGREKIPLLIAQGLRSRGHDCRVIAIPNTAVAKAAKKAKIPVHMLNVASRWDLLGALAFRRLVLNLRPEILVFHFGTDLALWAMASVGLAERPASIHCLHVGSNKKKKDLYHRWIYGRVAKIVPFSRFLYRNAVDTLPVEKGKILRIPLGIEEKAFAKIKPRYRVRPRAVGYMSRLAEGKGQDDLIKAWALLPQKWKLIKLFLAGGATPRDRPYVESLASLVSKLGLGKSVRFIGHVDNVPKFMAGLDLFVFPSRDEAFGISLVEAMAAGLPVAGAAAGGVLEIVRQGKDGLLFRPGVPSDIAKSITKLLGSHLLRKRMGTSGRSRALGKMRLSRTIILFERLLINISQKRTLRQGGGPQCSLREPTVS